MSDAMTINGKKAVRCPNPDCDVEDGCCVCEHTGWVWEYAFAEQPKEPHHARDKDR